VHKDEGNYLSPAMSTKWKNNRLRAPHGVTFNRRGVSERGIYSWLSVDVARRESWWSVYNVLVEIRVWGTIYIFPKQSGLMSTYAEIIREVPSTEVMTVHT
jgi:hypothetical protein